MMEQYCHSYSRRQAIADGVLLDISDRAKEAGFCIPVAITAGCWSACVSVPTALAGWQDEEGRAWDVIWMLRYAIKSDEHRKQVNGPNTQVDFSLTVQNSPGQQPEIVNLKAIHGPGDDGNPVITIMLPGED